MNGVLALWEVLYRRTGGYLALFSARRQRQAPGGDNRLVDARTRYFRYPRDAREAASSAMAASRSGRAALFCTHLLTSRRRIKEHAAPVGALWADYDAPELPEEMPPPTAVVRTSPTGYHLYWRLMRPLAPPEAEALNRRLSHAIGADKSGWPLTKLGRVPSTINHKYPQTQPVVTLQTLDAGAVYHPRELELWLPGAAGSPPSPNAAPAAVLAGPPAGVRDTNGTPELARLSPRMRRLISDGNSRGDYPSRSEADFAICIAMFGAGYDEHDVWRVMTDPANGISERYRQKGLHGVSYLVHTIGKARLLARPAAA